jgi:hypothetical protein
MKITILGTRGEIPDRLPYHSRRSGILVDDQLLIDLGEKEFLNLNPRWILISHFHPDHAYFIRSGKKEIPETQAKIYAPESCLEVSIPVNILDKKTKIGPYTVIPIPTIHGKYVKTQGYLIKKGKVSFLYTADLIWITKEFHPVIGHVDLVITEASFIEREGMVKKDRETGRIFGHNGVPNIISLVKRFSENVLFVHFGTWFFDNTKEGRKLLKRLGKENNINVIVGYDGLVVDLI